MIWDALLLFSVAWVCLRLYQLSQISRETLEERLGYDIPPAPEVSVAGIGERSISLFWLNSKHSGFASVTLSILVNGIKLGDFVRGETLIEILNLFPDCCYNIKCLSTNSNNLITASAAIRIQTLPEVETSTTSETAWREQAATIRTSSSVVGSPALQPPSSDGLASQQAMVKSALIRRTASPSPSCPIPTEDLNDSSNVAESNSTEYIQQLTARLELLKTHKEDIDRQIEDEETEAKLSHADLYKERDELRHDLREKEESSAELRRQGNHLDKLNRSAQSRKSMKEKLLQQKRADRQKVQDDILRWDLEVIEMGKQIEEAESERAILEDAKSRDLTEIQQAITTDYDGMKALEDEIREKGAYLKVLEQQKDQLTTDEANEPERAKSERAKEEAWDTRYQAMQTQLHSMWQALQQSKAEEQKAEVELAWWYTKRVRGPDEFAPVPALDNISRNSRNASRRNRSRPLSQLDQNYFGSQGDFGGAPPPYSAATVTLPETISGSKDGTNFDQSGMTSTDIDNLTGGALTSPAANDLLPSYILRDEDTTTTRLSGVPTSAETDYSSATQFIRHTLSNSDASGLGPNTPLSSRSRTGSVLASPHGSQQNVSSFLSENDRRSTSSTSAPLDPSLTDTTAQPASRFANLFSSPFGRQRGKSSAQEPPALGTLKQGQSQSYPRNIDQDGFDVTGIRRRRGSHGTWANPVAGLLNRNNSNTEGNIIRARTGSGRSSRLNLFKPRMNAMDPTSITEQESSSSRPSSTYSFDQHFRRPSSESQSIWSPFSDNVADRSSPLNAKWAANPGPWSRGPSRSASVQHGSSTNLSIGSTPLDVEGFSRPLSKHRTEQAPIGTRPISQRTSTPKLNPAAPTFKMVFGRSEAKKNAKHERSNNKFTDAPKSRDGEKGDSTNTVELHEEVSIPHPRLSRDAQSISTAASTADSHESFERTTSGQGSESTVPKESLMQKISRKSSSSKFNVPWSKERGFFSKRAGEPSTPGEIDEDNTSEGQLGKSADSVSSAPHTPREEKSARAWPSIRRKSRKGLEALEKGNEAGDGEE